jgi:chromosome segregation ATPase
MFIEDLSSRVFALRAKKAQRQSTIDGLNSQIENLRRAQMEAQSALDAKSCELRTYQAQAQVATQRLQEAASGIEHTERALDDAGQRLEHAREQTQRLVSEHAELDRQMVELHGRFAEEMADLDRCQAEFEANIVAIKNSKAGEMTAYEDRIQKLRHKITSIRERDSDPDIPAVDVDLRRQVERVRAYEQDLIKESERCEEETKRLDVQMKQKTWDLQTLAMKTQPTASILAMPEFHEKFILLRELVLQNMEMKMEMASLTERIVVLKQENNAIRKRLSTPRL